MQKVPLQGTKSRQNGTNGYSLRSIKIGQRIIEKCSIVYGQLHNPSINAMEMFELRLLRKIYSAISIGCMSYPLKIEDILISHFSFMLVQCLTCYINGRLTLYSYVFMVSLVHSYTHRCLITIFTSEFLVTL